MFGVENVDLVSMTFLTKEGNGLAKELGAKQRRTLPGRQVGIVASQTGDVSAGRGAPPGVEQGQRDGFGNGGGRLSR